MPFTCKTGTNMTTMTSNGPLFQPANPPRKSQKPPSYSTQTALFLATRATSLSVPALPNALFNTTLRSPREVLPTHKTTASNPTPPNPSLPLPSLHSRRASTPTTHEPHPSGPNPPYPLKSPPTPSRLGARTQSQSQPPSPITDPQPPQPPNPLTIPPPIPGHPPRNQAREIRSLHPSLRVRVRVLCT